MAIKINKAKRSRVGLARIITTLIFVAIAGATVYFLFFAPTPAFEYIAPAPLERNKELSTFDLDPEAIFSDPQFQTFQVYHLDSGEGSFGRQNPFSRP